MQFDGEDVIITVDGTQLHCDGSIIDIATAQVSLERHSVNILTGVGVLAIEAATTEQLIEFYEAIRHQAIQTNFYEQYELEDGRYTELNTGEVLNVRVLEKVNEVENLKFIQTLRQLPKQYLQVSDVYEELDHYYIVYQSAELGRMDNALVFYQGVFALQSLNQIGYVHGHLDENDIYYRNGQLMICASQIEPYSLAGELHDVSCLATLFSKYIDNDMITQLITNPISVMELMKHQWFIEELGIDVVNTKSVKTYTQTTGYHKQKLSMQFVLDELYNQQLLNSEQYQSLQDAEEQSFCDFKKTLQKEIEQGPSQGSTCPSTMQVQSKEIVTKTLADLMMQAEQIENAQVTNQKSKITTVRKGLIDLML